MLIFSALLVTAAIAAAPVPTAPAVSAPTWPQGPGTLAGAVVSGVTVTSRKGDTVQALQRFGRSAAGGRIARWHAPVCPRVSGVPATFAGFTEARIAFNARLAGGLAGEGRCAPNVLILFTPTPDLLASEMATRRPQVFRGSGGRLNQTKLAHFLNDRAPVRVFRAEEVVPTSGGEAGAPEAVNMSAALSLSEGFFAAPDQMTGSRQFGGVRASRLDTSSDEALTRVVIIVDSNKAAGCRPVKWPTI